MCFMCRNFLSTQQYYLHLGFHCVSSTYKGNCLLTYYSFQSILYLAPSKKSGLYKEEGTISLLDMIAKYLVSFPMAILSANNIAW